MSTRIAARKGGKKKTVQKRTARKKRAKKSGAASVKKAAPKKTAARKHAAKKKPVKRAAAKKAASPSKERRIDRSPRTSEALDKILQAALRRHKLTAAVLSDAAGLLVATALDRGGGERLAGIVSLSGTLRDYLASYEVLDGLSQAVLLGRGGRGLGIWPFTVSGDVEVILAILFKKTPPPGEAIAEMVRGVRRIVETRAA